MSALIDDYLAGLRRRLPAPIAEEAAAGLLETYEHHLGAGAGVQDAARSALAEFGDLDTVAGEFTRQAPGRHAARLLLATGPVAGLCWAAALVSGRAWNWPWPASARLIFGGALLLAVVALAVAATSRHSYQRTTLAMLASPVVLVLDTAAITAALLTAPALTWTLGVAVTVSLGRIALNARMLPRLTPR